MCQVYLCLKIDLTRFPVDNKPGCTIALPIKSKRSWSPLSDRLSWQQMARLLRLSPDYAGLGTNSRPLDS